MQSNRRGSQNQDELLLNKEPEVDESKRHRVAERAMNKTMLRARGLLERAEQERGGGMSGRGQEDSQERLPRQKGGLTRACSGGREANLV
jgi:hypothetical protein